jgi:hypothetical protein
MTNHPFNGWKYILFTDTDGGDAEIALPFHPMITHKDFAKTQLPRRPVSAGFIRVFGDHGDVHIECYGSSDSLGIRSNKGDVDFFEGA